MRAPSLRGTAPAAGGPPVRLGIVGCGMVAERGHLPALRGAKGIRLAAVADPNPARRRIPGVPGYADIERMLAAEDLEAVLICSPPALHLALAEACAAAGIPALVEKPPGLTLEDARRLAALRPAPVVGFNRRFAGHLPTGRRQVAEPIRVTAIFDAPPGDWDRGEATDPLLDLGCHLVDLGCWITGAAPARARALDLGPGRAGCEAELAGGQRLLAECGAAMAYRELLEVRGDGGDRRTWSWPPPRGRATLDRIARRPSPLIRTWRAQLESFARAVRGGGPGRLASAREAVTVMAVLEAAQRSAARGGEWITVASDPPGRDELSG